MAIGWLSVLKMVPWSDVIQNAPKAAESARKLWGSVGRNPPPAGADATSDAHAPLPGGSATLAALQRRIDALEEASDALHGQMLASSALIKTLAEQNTQLIARVEVNRVRLLALAALALLALLVAVAATALAFYR